MPDTINSNFGGANQLLDETIFYCGRLARLICLAGNIGAAS
jgi:hypothetical protein